MPLERLVRYALDRRWAVLIVWTLVACVCAFASLRVPALLTNTLSLPGTESDRAETWLENHFQQSSVGSFMLVVTTGDSAQTRLTDAQAAAQRAADALPTGEIVDSLVIGDDLVIVQISSSLAPAAAKRYTDAMRAAVGTVPRAEIYLSGFPATEHDVDAIMASDLRKGELLIAVPLAIVLLIVVFRTLACLLPILFAFFTITTTTGLLWVCAHVMELTAYITNFVSLIGLGIAIDYSLLMVHRFREELGSGAPPEEAIVRTMSSAGRTVVFSGTAVAIGLALLVVLPLPFLRGFGIGGLLIPVVSVAAAITLQPVLLLLLGQRLDRIKLLPGRLGELEVSSTRGFWPVLARWTLRRPILCAAASALLLLWSSAPLRDLKIGPGFNVRPQFVESVRGQAIVAAAFGAGATTPTSIVIDAGREGAATDPQLEAAVDRLLFALDDDPQLAGLYFMPGRPPFVDSSLRFLHLLVLSKQDFAAPETLAFVDRLRTRLIPAARFPSEARVAVGGAGPAGVDFMAIVARWFPWLVAGMLGATYLLLLRAFRSLLLPLKAIVLNVLSVTAASGLTVAVFEWGWGRPLGLPVYARVEAWIPVMLVAVVFGLSMDYEVFLVRRMREAWDGGASNEQAVIAGLARTGRLVTAAGLVMFAAFIGFVSGSIMGLQQFGFALAMSILIDVTIVRALLLPATMGLLGRWNWYLPGAVATLVRVAPSPLR
jgi:putative drug exporter of the RND superfamily